MDGAGPTKRIGENSTNTGLAARMSRLNGEPQSPSLATRPKRSSKARSTASDGATASEQVVTTRGADELLARAREAGADEAGPDSSTLADIQSLLRDV